MPFFYEQWEHQGLENHKILDTRKNLNYLIYADLNLDGLAVAANSHHVRYACQYKQALCFLR